jgi:hypothetical protein
MEGPVVIQWQDTPKWLSEERNVSFEIKSDVSPHEQRPDLRRGWLNNGNPPGDFLKAPRCDARNRKERGVSVQQCGVNEDAGCMVENQQALGRREEFNESE